MELGSWVRRGGFVALVALVGCSKTEEAGKPPAERASSEATLAPKPAKPAAKPGPREGTERPAPKKAELPPVAARGALLHRLPKSTLLAVRLPNVDRLDDAWRRSPLHSLLEMPAMAAQREQMEQGYAQMNAGLAKAFPDLEKLKSKVLALQGEVVIALVSIDAAALAKDGGDVSDCPLTAALMYDAGESADEVQELLERLFKEMSKANDPPGRVFELVAEQDETWHRRMAVEGACIDFVREGTQFVLQVGPAANAKLGGTPLPKRSIEDSFLATDVVRATPELPRDTTLCFAEMFLNLTPVWTAAELLAPPDVKAILTGSGATSILGVSLTAGLGRSGIDEVVMIHSPGGKDLLTQVLTNRPLDPKLARYLPSDAKVTSLTTFDFAALFDGVMKLMPSAEKKQAEAMLAGMKSEGFDLRGDVLGNIGPTFGFVGGADFFKTMLDLGMAAESGGSVGGRGALDLTFLVELQDSPRFKRLLDKAFRSSGIAAHVRPEVVQGVPTSRLEAFPVPGPDGRVIAMIEPSWHVGEHALVFCTSNAALERSLAAARDANNRGPKPMRAALEQSVGSLWAVNANAAMDGMPESTTIGTRTPFGLELSSREGSGIATTYVLGGGVAMLAAVAIPNLLSARLDANEKAAVATLRAIASAQAQYRANAFVDQDGDGRGEYGTLAELVGAAPPAGGKEPVSPPVLATAMTPDARGCFVKAGYVFRVDVPRRSIGGADAAEQRFVAYAWPVSWGSTGGDVYVIDAEATIFFSDNRGTEQHYQGQDRTPATDAADLRDDSDRVAGVTAVRRGRDGGIWLEYE